MALSIANPIGDYFSADALFGSGGVAGLFAHDAEVHDGGRIYRGVEAIMGLKARDKMKHTHSVDPLTFPAVDGRTVIAVEVAGDAPDSPVALWHAFTIANGRITDLDIRV